MATVTICSNHPSTATPFPPIGSKSNTKPLLQHHHLQFSGKPKHEFAMSRRHLPVLLVLLPSLPLLPPPAFAFNLGISGPKDWLKEQKKKSIKYLLAPIDASLDLLQSAYELLSKDSSDKQKDWEQIQGLLRSASRDCVPEERSSLVAFQSRTGVEVCTFKLIVKNASSLLDDKDPMKVKAEAMLGDLIRSFTVLNGVAKEANYRLVSDSFANRLVFSCFCRT
ncbi:hypothetical protein Cgig2_021183 [Carnegiea gigantea]|uniref:Uncharacterized protein n=1 Tax=Carnegiea gigantea TaxID=171969 RepID=A0A9Q1KXP2_9CARY|nr:hypothetical protein Cgig2_021183 [Carnegiea gigantea]